MTTRPHTANESQYKHNNQDHNNDHNHNYDHSDGSNRNTADEAFVISVWWGAKTKSSRQNHKANVYRAAFIGTLRQLTRAEVCCDTRQWFEWTNGIARGFSNIDSISGLYIKIGIKNLLDRLFPMQMHHNLKILLLGITLVFGTMAMSRPVRLV